jgi:hypothetical protein
MERTIPKAARIFFKAYLLVLPDRPAEAAPW